MILSSFWGLKMIINIHDESNLDFCDFLKNTFPNVRYEHFSESIEFDSSDSIKEIIASLYPEFRNNILFDYISNSNLVNNYVNYNMGDLDSLIKHIDILFFFNSISLKINFENDFFKLKFSIYDNDLKNKCNLSLVLVSDNFYLSINDEVIDRKIINSDYCFIGLLMYGKYFIKYLNEKLNTITIQDFLESIEDHSKEFILLEIMAY